MLRPPKLEAARRAFPNDSLESDAEELSSLSDQGEYESLLSASSSCSSDDSPVSSVSIGGGLPGGLEPLECSASWHGDGRGGVEGWIDGAGASIRWLNVAIRDRGARVREAPAAAACAAGGLYSETGRLCGGVNFSPQGRGREVVWRMAVCA